MGGKVLIIDDDPALLRLMSMAFQQAGYGVVAADNGRKGIRMASAHKPDLVVTDIVMPDIEGIGAIRAIKQGARPPKVIAISGAEKVIERNLDTDANRKIVETFLASIPASKPDRASR